MTEVVCADTNCIIAYLAGDTGADIEFLDKLLRRRVLILPPVVLAELLSDSTLPKEAETFIIGLPRLSADAGYWLRAGKLRAAISAGGRSTRLADALIAQSCLDHNAPLLTRDAGFRRFQKAAGLKLV